MYAKYSSSPETWTVAKLATTYGINQPRVQAILLLKEWEKADRALGLVTEDDDELEDLVRPPGVFPPSFLVNNSGCLC